MNETTVTTPSEVEIRVERIFDAPRAHVFSVWTDPELIPQWWGDGTVVEEMDVRPGGAYRFRTAFGVVTRVSFIVLLSCVRRPARSGRAAAATR
ncbi:MAG TPA: SRPBCC domain-containing protein [Gaiellaceae bacterium]|nr:SRPBCC domain-containing protein [Gaiellaceae bacterium]